MKDNDTNHMLWFAPAKDGPTWYVGKREEVGQPRGWLQVKSDAASPAEIKGTWGIWLAAEKAWKEGRDVKCVAVSATPGVYIHGPNTRYDKVLDGNFQGIYTFWIAWKQLPLLRGRYRLSVAVFDKNHLKPHVWHNQLHDFEVVSDLEDHGTVLLDHGWGLISHVEGDQADVAPLSFADADTSDS